MAMIKAVGTDLVDVARIEAALTRHPRFADRVFSRDERHYCEAMKTPTIHFAARFAAKEAVMKVLGRGFGQAGVRFADIEIVRDDHGVPSVVLHGPAATVAKERGIAHILVSMTHTETQAMAFAIGQAVV